MQKIEMKATHECTECNKPCMITGQTKGGKLTLSCGHLMDADDRWGALLVNNAGA